MYTAYLSSPVGLLKIQCSDEHLLSVVFTDGDVPPPGDDHPLLLRCVCQLQDYFSGTRNAFDLPLKQEGTPFQQKVWNLLQQIPFGKTLSYHEFSKRYGDAKAIRAVASANGKNNLAVVVPCHRVIGSNQSLTGYAGGLWRKRWLLAHEAKYFSGVRELEFGT